MVIWAWLSCFSYRERMAHRGDPVDVGDPPGSRAQLESDLLDRVDAVLSGTGEAAPADGRPWRRGLSVAVEGHPGMGKSHLGRMIAARADRHGARVLIASGRERLSRNGFATIHELVGDSDPGRDPGEEAFGRIDAWASQGPVLCWVDDLQWADSASLSALRRLVWAARDLPLVIVLAGRSVPVRESVAMVVRSVDHRVVLPPMADMAVEAMTQEIVGGWPGPRLRQHLQACRGNPLFVADVLGRLAAADRLAPAGRDRVDLVGQPPPAGAGLQAQLDDHLRQVDESALEVLGALAVWGTPASRRDLTELLYAGEGALDPAIASAVTSGVVHWSVDGPDPRLRFAHDLYRERAELLLESGVRRATHRRAAHLRGRAGDGPAVVAEHLLLAADPDGPTQDAALLTALRSAAEQAGAWAPAVSAELLGDLRMADPLAAGDEVVLDQVHALYAAGEQARAVEVAARHLAATTDRAVAAALQTTVLRALVNRGDTDAAGRAIERTLSVPHLPDGVRRQLTQLRCWVRLLGGDRAGARVDLDPLLVQARSAQDTDVEFGLLTTAAILEYLEARPRSSLALVERQRQLTLTDTGLQGRISALIWPPLFHLYADGPQVAQQVSVQARRTGADLGAGWLDPFHSFVAAGIAVVAGQWADAAAEADTGLELAEEVGTGWTSLAVGDRAGLEVHRGHLAAARRRLADFVRDGLPLQFGSPETALAGLLLAEAGGTATPATARGLWSAAGSAGALFALRSAPDVARLALTGWDPELGARVAADVDAIPTDQVPLLAATADLVGGMATGSVVRLEGAARAATGSGNVPLGATAHEELAYAAGSAGRADLARSALDSAVAIYTELGATVDRDRALARLRTVGIRRGPRSTHRGDVRGPAGLTPTERRVTTLVQEGLTNPEIASRLFLSPRTVQTHVSHVLAKLGARSRVEVARMDLGDGPDGP